MEENIIAKILTFRLLYEVLQVGLS